MIRTRARRRTPMLMCACVNVCVPVAVERGRGKKGLGELRRRRGGARVCKGDRKTAIGPTFIRCRDCDRSNRASFGAHASDIGSRFRCLAKVKLTLYMAS